jgi:hypothetical protein
VPRPPRPPAPSRTARASESSPLSLAPSSDSAVSPAPLASGREPAPGPTPPARLFSRQFQRFFTSLSVLCATMQSQKHPTVDTA